MGSILDGQPVNALVTNTSKLDRITDDTAFGVITLNNTGTAASGPLVTNLQENVNNEIQNDKLFIKSDGDGLVSWDGTNLSFTDNIVIYSKDYSVSNTILAAQSPIALSDGQSIYVTLSRYSNATVTATVTSSLGQGKDVLRFATRVGSSLVFWDNSLLRSGVTARIGEGVASSQVLATAFDPVSTVLPTGLSIIVDGYTLVDGDTVLFANLLAGNNEVYKFNSGVFTAQNAFNGTLTPSNGDTVRILKGDGFSDQVAVFNGTSFKVNEVVRYFNGTDYWEANSLQTANISNNTTASLFTVAYAGSQNIVIHYSVLRGTLKEAGTLHVVTDGVTASVSQTGTFVSSCGVSFSAAISGSNLILSYTSDNSGSSGTMKYFMFRWSDAAGGPSGVPSYSGGTSPSGAAGADTDIQYNQSGVFTGSSALRFNYSSSALILSSLEMTGIATATLSNNVTSPTTFASFPISGYRFLILEYSIDRNGTYQVGRLLIVHDGFNASVSDDSTTIPSSPGVFITGAISGASLNLQYTSSNTGFNSVLKYSTRKWI